MGWWPFVQPRINTAVRDLLSRDGDGDGGGGGGGSLGGGGGRTARYVGRPSTASPATGSQSIHALEMKSIVQEALRGVTEFPTKYAGPYGGGGGGG
jgi:2-oxoglutarate dehydrogenase E1 component